MGRLTQRRTRARPGHFLLCGKGNGPIPGISGSQGSKQDTCPRSHEPKEDPWLASWWPPPSPVLAYGAAWSMAPAPLGAACSWVRLGAPAHLAVPGHLLCWAQLYTSLDDPQHH